MTPFAQGEDWATPAESAICVDSQGKLLRVLQKRELQRPDSSESVGIDVRVVAATNCDLIERIEESAFAKTSTIV